MTYTEDLESEHWKELRKLALARAGNRCESCGTGAGLDGHHLRYCSPLTDGVAEDVMMLCRGCHEKWHEWQKGNVPHGVFTREMTKGALAALRSVKQPVPKKKTGSKAAVLRNAMLRDDVLMSALREKGRKDFKRWLRWYFRDKTNQNSLTVNALILFRDYRSAKRAQYRR